MCQPIEFPVIVMLLVSILSARTLVEQLLILIYKKSESTETLT